MFEITSAYMQVERALRNFLPRNATSDSPLSWNNIIERFTNVVLMAWLRVAGNTDVAIALGDQGSTLTQIHPGVTSVGKPEVSVFGSKLRMDGLRLYLSVGSDVINLGSFGPLAKKNAIKKSADILVNPNLPTAGLQQIADAIVLLAAARALMLLYRQKMGARKLAARALTSVAAG